MVQPTWLFSLLILTLQLSASGVNSTKFTLVNQCNYTVWPALSGDDYLSTTGFVLRSGESSTVTPPAKWKGLIWGRTLCTNSSATGNFSCVTGDCGSGKIACYGRTASMPPVTRLEFSLSDTNFPDIYDVSLAVGFNVPAIIVPISSSSKCNSTGCAVDMNRVCPTELKTIKNGQVVGCQNPNPCIGDASSNCEPSVYSKIFKTSCPQAFSYPKDDRTSTFICYDPVDYNIVFCPTSSNTSQSVGDSLMAGNGTSRWLSPSGDFAFGFYQLPNEFFLLAVWYDKMPNKTIIWFANGDNPAPIGSRLELNDSGLVLNNPQGLELWRSNFVSGTIFNGLMNDDGNFQLLDQNSVSLWETFTHPTDTLVPNQVMELNGKLFSRRGEFNFSHGRFKLHLQEDGNLVLSLNLPSNYSYEPYYDTGTADANSQTNIDMKLIFDKSGFLYILKKSGEKFYITKPNETISTNDFYYKATINYDGVFTVSYYPKDLRKGQGWVTTKTIPENICLSSTFTDGEGVCGFNSICNLKADQRPICNCPERYSLIDSNNMYGGCIPKLTSFPNPNGKKDHDVLIVMLSVLLAGSVLIILMLVGALYFGFSCNRKKIESSRTNKSVAKKNLHDFTFKELVEATNNFREELGRGSFSIVYKGTIEMTSVAVKKLDKLFQDNDREFQTEVNVIGQTHHRNLVRLLGYCNEGQHRILVYEFMSNGTLASFLFSSLKSNWGQRFDIALGIARGLVYLHEECCTQIIHCDIKPQNILLDDQYNARISDFGLAKLLLINQSRTETGIRGTKGYVAPDWFRSAPITAKVDTYSFGVLLLEIICCRKNVEKELVNEEKGILTDWAYDCYKTRRLEILLENDDEAINDIKSFEKLVMIAIWCIQEHPSLRPTMKKVLLMLEGNVEVLTPPSPYLHGSISEN
ncbi:G-type lectin S-receptor-like serine/threonine-protein kinase LECRK3 isoform X3 [Glycine soja]|uniref:G-type lectin S-receptor-like serine/threonine-protein kinase LECRK3 isoform X3 n=1 Tax=Glycine soja TaxID=3848 RepID=UPI00103CF457|nr:G-type lectin S-receptor-like serine/threonine-protein kinase LECRK3 isoform X3 [Glycine soja]